MSDKQKLGQFYTTRYEYILQNMNIPSNISNIIEPFAGNGDLLNFIENEDINIECFDIDPKKPFINRRDTLVNPPDYDNKFIITNPPFLARNKSQDKTIYDKYNQNDLYKCFIETFIDTCCIGGIIIIPLNFWCSIRTSDVQLRKKFLEKFSIITLNIFEERVFDDTSYATCCFQFKIKTEEQDSINCFVYPEKINLNLVLNENNNYTIGGEIYNLPKNKKIKVERATSKNKDDPNITNILAKCLDDNKNSKISLSMVSNDKRIIDESPKLSARSYATLIIKPKLTLEKQEELVEKFNTYLEEQREKYHSLFLTNYRESNDIARKRISFNLVFDIVNYLIST